MALRLRGPHDSLFEASTQFCGGNLVVRKLEPGDQPGEWVPRAGWPITATFPDGDPPPRPRRRHAATPTPGRWPRGNGSTPATHRRSASARSSPPDEAVLSVSCTSESGSQWRFDDPRSPSTYPGTTRSGAASQRATLPDLMWSRRPDRGAPGGRVARDLRRGGRQPERLRHASVSPASADDQFGDLLDADNPDLGRRAVRRWPVAAAPGRRPTAGSRRWSPAGGRCRAPRRRHRHRGGGAPAGGRPGRGAHGDRRRRRGPRPGPGEPDPDAPAEPADAPPHGCAASAHGPASEDRLRRAVACGGRVSRSGAAGAGAVALRRWRAV